MRWGETYSQILIGLFIKYWTIYCISCVQHKHKRANKETAGMEKPDSKDHFVPTWVSHVSFWGGDACFGSNTSYEPYRYFTPACSQQQRSLISPYSSVHPPNCKDPSNSTDNYKDADGKRRPYFNPQQSLVAAFICLKWWEWTRDPPGQMWLMCSWRGEGVAKAAGWLGSPWTYKPPAGFVRFFCKAIL